MMRNIETFPSKQMYPYLSLVERKVAEFYLYIDRMKGGGGVSVFLLKVKNSFLRFPLHSK